MLVLKYRKTDTARFISHLDFLRCQIRAIQRTGINVEYSQGYNPHMLINLSQPTPIGIASEAEYMVINTAFDDTNAFLDKYNKVCVPGTSGICTVNVKFSPNIAGSVNAAKYVYEDVEIAQKSDELNSIMASDTYEIEYVYKGETVKKDVRKLIFSLKNNSERVEMVLASGNINLRADRLLRFMTESLGTKYMPNKLIKTNQLILNGQDTIDVDEYLKRFM